MHIYYDTVAKFQLKCHFTVNTTKLKKTLISIYEKKKLNRQLDLYNKES